MSYPMKKLLTKRNKLKLSSYLKVAKRNDLSLAFWLTLKKQLSEHKAVERKSRHGTKLCWQNFEWDSENQTMTVPVHSRKTNEILSYRFFLEKSMLPTDKQYLWPEKGHN